MSDLFEDDLRRIQVLIPLPLAGPYDYLADAGSDLVLGSIVEVPLGNRRTTGVVWNVEVPEAPESGQVDRSRLKPVIRRLPVPALPEPVIRLVDWVASYTLSAQGAVLRMAISVPDAFEPAKPVIAYTALPGGADAVEALGLRITPARRRVLDLLEDGPPRTAREIADETGTGTSVVKGLADGGGLVSVALPADAPFPEPDPDRLRETPLSEEQAEAAGILTEAVRAESFSTMLLDGETGAGKTEVYFEAVAEALRHGKQVLVLLPEIALSAEWLNRFEARFGVRPAEWHSDLKPRRRRHTWRAVAEGKAKVLVGARSALFLPFPDLGLIVVDEEHESAYKQEEGVVYHGRDMAVVRANLTPCPVVLVSATPALESMRNAEQGRYRHLRLTARHGAATLPSVELVDLRRHQPERGRWLARPLLDAMTGALEAGEQSLVFLNRRGYAPLTLCRACGHRLECPSCSAWLVEHRLLGKLQCHHCGYSARLPKACPACGEEDSFIASGPGVERMAEEVAALFPEARFQIVSSDTLNGPAAAAEFVRSVRDGEVDIILGTQIVAKGYHFPKLTVVGVVDADLGLAGGDLRAAERTYQLLHQVAGRAGRAEHPGRVLLQTHQPENPVLRALADWDRDGFLAEEAAARERQGMPPFGRLAGLIVSAADPNLADMVASRIGRAAPDFDGVAVLGPAPAPLALLRGRHRRRLLVKTRRDINIQAVLRDWLGRIDIPSSVRLTVDIDPYSFL
ncbi:primosomal protein N' [Nisaea acidiphila]|uniref:Replication restart protein PriA n=1 Tax=Nisaea acidiphila TaxID=1862145 RepID=A0A9J7ANB4_9PROT|nr:primosomal protein N' [Nisaea acidiphila]UUX48073.1 primosomal protein N' [Nisaea acidiphila]